jgi:hypothetical protein
MRPSNAYIFNVVIIILTIPLLTLIVLTLQMLVEEHVATTGLLTLKVSQP